MVQEIGVQIYIFGTNRVRKVVDVSLERSCQDKLKAVSFIQISGAVPEFRGGGYFQLWN